MLTSDYWLHDTFGRLTRTEREALYIALDECLQYKHPNDPRMWWGTAPRDVGDAEKDIERAVASCTTRAQVAEEMLSVLAYLLDGEPEALRARKEIPA